LFILIAHHATKRDLVRDPIDGEGAMVIPPEDREYFERLGEAEVLLSLSTDGFDPPRQIYARPWIAERAEAQRSVNEERRGNETKRPGSADKAT
jgi:hypothetical protein